MKRLCLLLICAASGAWGQTVQVRSGDHPGFTRIAFSLPAAQDWKLGRTESGYALRLENPVRFDIGRVFRVISRNRIAALRVDPETSDLRIELACNCHAIPFEARPGVIAIDIKPGPAPKGSSFELALDAPPEALRVEPSPAPGYDWRSLPPAKTEVTFAADLDPLREALLRQLADGAARGVVDIVDTLPERPAKAEPEPMPAQVRIAETPGFIADPAEPLTPEGRVCIPDAEVDIANWGNDLPPSEELAVAREGLVGEFDHPDANALARAIRYYLHLGFGAEARQLAQTYSIDSGDRALWVAMADVLDGRPQTTKVLTSMAACDGAVAMWAILALPTPQEPEQTDAALRSFAALPKHLRQHIGPMLSDRFTARRQANAALMVRDAVARAETEQTTDTRLMSAIAATDETALVAMVNEGGTPSSDALIELADRRLAAHQPLDTGTVTALAALLHERRGTEDEARLKRLHRLALASVGEFDAAFAEAPEPELWGWLARSGGDSALLAHAVLPADTALPDTSRETRLLMAKRLVDLGLADPALIWLERGDRLARAPEEERLLAAAAEMQRRDARRVLTLVAGLQGPQADTLRVKALEQLGDTDRLREEQDPAAILRSARREGDWDLVAADDTADWAAAAATVTPSLPDVGGPLARGREMVSDAAAARARINALLGGVTVP